MERYSYKSHTLGAAALVTMGNAVVTMPFYQTQKAISVFLITAVITVAFLCVASLVLNFVFKSETSTFQKAVKYITCAAITVVSLYGAVFAGVDYINFVSKIQMPQNNVVALAQLLIVLSITFVFADSKAILKFCLFMSVLMVAAVTVLLAVSIKMFDFDVYKFNFGFSGNDCMQAFRIFLKYFLPNLALVAFVVISTDKSEKTNIICGTALGFVFILITLMQSIFVLGGAASDYPYIYAVSAYSSSSLFSRLDGLVYLVFFATCVSKIVICLKTLPLIVKNIKHSG